MNLTELLFEIAELGIQDQRLELDYRRIINRAQKAICERRNWTFMHGLLTVTIASGASNANLPSTFKELSAERSPVSYALTNGHPSAIELTSRAQLERLGDALVGEPIRFAFLERSGSTWTLNLPSGSTATRDTVFTLSAYSYMTDLALGTDHNELTDHGDLGDALINKAKAICYQSKPMDPNGPACEAAYDRIIRQASYADATKALGGRPMHW